METVNATMSINIHVDCPHCDEFIDLLDDDQTCDIDHDEEGYILKQALPDGHWHEEHDKFKVEGVTCTNCRGSFNVEKLNW